MAATIQGGEWIIKEVKSEDVFTSLMIHSPP